MPHTYLAKAIRPQHLHPFELQRLHEARVVAESQGRSFSHLHKLLPLDDGDTQVPAVDAAALRGAYTELKIAAAADLSNALLADAQTIVGRLTRGFASDLPPSIAEACLNLGFNDPAKNRAPVAIFPRARGNSDFAVEQLGKPGSACVVQIDPLETIDLSHWVTVPTSYQVFLDSLVLSLDDDPILDADGAEIPPPLMPQVSTRILNDDRSVSVSLGGIPSSELHWIYGAAVLRGYAKFGWICAPERYAKKPWEYWASLAAYAAPPVYDFVVQAGAVQVTSSVYPNSTITTDVVAARHLLRPNDAYPLERYELGAYWIEKNRMVPAGSNPVEIEAIERAVGGLAYDATSPLLDFGFRIFTDMSMPGVERQVRLATEDPSFSPEHPPIAFDFRYLNRRLVVRFPMY